MAYLKLGDINGKTGPAMLKLGDINGMRTSLSKALGSTATMNKLREAGMTRGGINALVHGGIITDKKDQLIVARLVAEALQ